MKKQFTTGDYASYVYIGENSAEDRPFITKEITNDINADYSAKDGRLVGIEILQHIPEKLEE